MLNIDSQVQQRMDQFRGRPQDLMQQYQMSRELIDLLALQKLKSEKDAAARSMMMQMQQNPQTIAAQREAELMGRTQQEVAQQVGGIAQLAEARKRQNLQRMASGAQPPVRMAQGGVARFAGPEGSFVDLGKLIAEASAKYGQLSPELLRAVIQQESGGNPKATSGAGARGLMQLMPITAEDLGVTNPDDLYDPAINIDAGARYLNQLLKQFGGDITAALSAYHSGPGRVSRLRKEYGDDYVDQLGPVGQRYATDVLNRIELSPGTQEQLATSTVRTQVPTVTTTVTPEPPRDTWRRRTDAYPAGGLDSLREALSRQNTTPRRQVDPALERQVATRMEPRVGDIRAAGSAITADGLSLLGRPLVRDGIASIVGALANRSASPLLQRQVVTGMEPTVEDLRAAGNAIDKFMPETFGRELRENIADYMEAEREDDESESPPSLGERIASRIASEQRVTRIPEYIASAVSGQKAAADAVREYLARVPGAVADLFSTAPTPAPSAAPMRDLTPEEARDVAGIDALLQRAAPRDEDVRVVDITPVQAPDLPDVTMPNVEADSLAAVEALRPSMSPEDAQRAAEERFTNIVNPAEYRRRAEERMGRLETLDERGLSAARERLAQLERLDAEQRAASAPDPDALAKERRSAFLRGLSGGSSLGYAGGAAGLASIREQQRAQEAARRQQIRDRLQERLGMGAEISAAERQSLMDIMGMQERADVSERDAAVRALEFGQEALRQGSMDRRQYAQLFTNLYTNNRTAAVAAMEENARNARTEYEQQMENARAAAEMATDSLEARRKYAIDAANARRALLEELSAINSALSMVPEEDRQPELDRLRAEVDEYMAEIDALR